MNHGEHGAPGVFCDEPEMVGKAGRQPCSDCLAFLRIQKNWFARINQPPAQRTKKIQNSAHVQRRRPASIFFDEKCCNNRAEESADLSGSVHECADGSGVIAGDVRACAPACAKQKI